MEEQYLLLRRAGSEDCSDKAGGRLCRRLLPWSHSLAEETFAHQTRENNSERRSIQPEVHKSLKMRQPESLYRLRVRSWPSMDSWQADPVRTLAILICKTNLARSRLDVVMETSTSQNAYICVLSLRIYIYIYIYVYIKW